VSNELQAINFKIDEKLCQVRDEVGVVPEVLSAVRHVLAQVKSFERISISLVAI
jgi:hypothetical protein